MEKPVNVTFLHSNTFFIDNGGRSIIICHIKDGKVTNVKISETLADEFTRVLTSIETYIECEKIRSGKPSSMTQRIVIKDHAATLDNFVAFVVSSGGDPNLNNWLVNVTTGDKNFSLPAGTIPKLVSFFSSRGSICGPMYVKPVEIKIDTKLPEIDLMSEDCYYYIPKPDNPTKYGIYAKVKILDVSRVVIVDINTGEKIIDPIEETPVEVEEPIMVDDQQVEDIPNDIETAEPDPELIDEPESIEEIAKSLDIEVTTEDVKSDNCRIIYRYVKDGKYKFLYEDNGKYEEFDDVRVVDKVPEVDKDYTMLGDFTYYEKKTRDLCFHINGQPSFDGYKPARKINSVKQVQRPSEDIVYILEKDGNRTFFTGVDGKLMDITDDIPGLGIDYEETNEILPVNKRWYYNTTNGDFVKLTPNGLYLTFDHKYQDINKDEYERMIAQ